MWFLMPSVLLVQQIPYRVMSLGLKAVIRQRSHCACLRMCSDALAPRLAVGPSPFLTRRGGVLGRDLARWGLGLPFCRTAGLSYPSVLRANASCP